MHGCAEGAGANGGQEVKKSRSLILVLIKQARKFLRQLRSSRPPGNTHSSAKRWQYSCALDARTLLKRLYAYFIRTPLAQAFHLLSGPLAWNSYPWELAAKCGPNSTSNRVERSVILIFTCFFRVKKRHRGHSYFLLTILNSSYWCIGTSRV